MRYVIRDEDGRLNESLDLEWEAGGDVDLPVSTGSTDRDDDPQAGDDVDVDDAMGGDADGPDAVEPEPPEWAAADGNTLQLPPPVLQSILSPGRPRPPRWWSWWRRRRSHRRRRPASPRTHRRRADALRNVGRVVRRARRAGTLRSRRTGRRFGVFRAPMRGRSLRIVTRPRGRLRHEILHIGPEPRTGPAA